MAKPLTDIGIQALGPGKYPDGGGLYLQVTESKNGRRHSWLFRYFVARKERQMGLGPYPHVRLKEARRLAAEAREKRKRGIDPLGEREQLKRVEFVRVQQGRTFDEIADEYIQQQRPAWQNSKHADQWKSTLRTYASPAIGKLPIGEVTTAHVAQILRPIWTTKAETAQRVRGRIEAILDYAKVLGLRAGENPALWRGNLSHVFPARARVKPVQHHPALPWAELPKFMNALAEQRGMGARALEFVILTAARSGEVRGACWSEIDGDVWTIPASRMKSRREHRVPLSPAALAVLAAAKAKLGGGSDLVVQSPDPTCLIFPGQRRSRPLSDMSLTAVLRRMKIDVTAHGFRSSFRDWASEMTNHSREVVEMALAHTIESKVEAAYRRGDLFLKRRALMNDWAFFAVQA